MYLKSDLLCRFCIDDELELCRLIKRNFSRVLPPQHLSDLTSRVTKRIEQIDTIRHKPAPHRKIAEWLHS
jgi:hypothetical protein